MRVSYFLTSKYNAAPYFRYSLIRFLRLDGNLFLGLADDRSDAIVNSLECLVEIGLLDLT